MVVRVWVGAAGVWWRQVQKLSDGAQVPRGWGQAWAPRVTGTQCRSGMWVWRSSGCWCPRLLPCLALPRSLETKARATRTHIAKHSLLELHVVCESSEQGTVCAGFLKVECDFCLGLDLSCPALRRLGSAGPEVLWPLRSGGEVAGQPRRLGLPERHQNLSAALTVDAARGVEVGLASLMPT